MIQATLSATGEPCVIMEPKDLRIGNILKYEGEYVHVTQVSMDIDDEYQEIIGFCKLGKHTDEIADWNRALCDKLNPVTLTPELLEILGFEITYPENDGGFDHYSIAGFPGFLYLGGTNYFFYTINDNPIVYLHQLQNIYFALTGEELEINH